MKKQLKKVVTAKEFDKQFDDGKSIIPYLDLTKGKLEKKIQRINVDFPSKFLKELDKEANKIGVARTALIKIWLAERLEQVAHF